MGLGGGLEVGEDFFEDLAFFKCGGEEAGDVFHDEEGGLVVGDDFEVFFVAAGVVVVFDVVVGFAVVADVGGEGVDATSPVTALCL